MTALLPFLSISILIHALLFWRTPDSRLSWKVGTPNGSLSEIVIEALPKGQSPTELAKGTLAHKGGIIDGKELGIPPPPYPEDSRLNQEQGTVTVTLLFDSENKLVSVSLAQSSTFAMLDNAVLKHLTQVLEPSLTKKVELERKVRFHFKLK